MLPQARRCARVWLSAGGEFSKTQSRLDAVYHATTTEELSQAYDEWAQSYDTDMALVGYRHPGVGVSR